MINSFARQLRELLAERSAPIAPGVFDGLSAKLTAAAGFRVAYMSGAAAAAAVTELPDIGLATQTELVNQVALLSPAWTFRWSRTPTPGRRARHAGSAGPRGPAATSHQTTRTPRRRSSLLLASTSGRTSVAEQFNSLFYRNCINYGLLALTVPGARELVTEGDQVSLDIEAGRLVNETTGGIAQAVPLPGFLREILAAGGIFPQLEANGRLRPSTEH